MSKDASSDKKPDDSNWHFDDSAIRILQIILVLVLVSVVLQVMRAREEFDFSVILMTAVPMVIASLARKYLGGDQDQDQEKKPEEK